MLAFLQTAEDVEKFLDDLCTYQEIEQMAERLSCAKYLHNGDTYNQIIAKTDVSSATLSRISRCIQRGSGGYAELLPRYLEETKP
ncbi:MAG: TrpR-related protein YerC/YecD [Clostridia bacterium]|nr:TrpR-related protein YerC/YecD [Clostridia bacterium]